MRLIGSNSFPHGQGVYRLIIIKPLLLNLFNLAAQFLLRVIIGSTIRHGRKKELIKFTYHAKLELTFQYDEFKSRPYWRQAYYTPSNIQIISLETVLFFRFT